MGLQLKHQRLNEFFGHLENTTVKDPAELNVKLMKKLNKSNKKLNADLNMVTFYKYISNYNNYLLNKFNSYKNKYIL